MRPLPSFAKLWEGYPDGGAAQVKRLVGGGANMAWLTNTCAIRMSVAFHHAGHPIPNGFPGLATTYGSDGKRYAFRAHEFKRFLQRHYGPPFLTGTDKDKFRGTKGVVMFDLQEDPDADGHLDVWDGSQIKYYDVFSSRYLRDAFMWRCPP